MHGIPFSIKDYLNSKGDRTTAGCVHLASMPRLESAACIVPILEAGGIPICKGNTPQACFNIHAYNFLWGTAQNIYDRTRSCAGSSGGDAGLVSSRCVPIAMGTDIGGSIRFPAHFTGICGFKPTGNRIS